MTDAPFRPSPDGPRPLQLFSDGLFSKWGFGDGDVAEDYLLDHLQEHELGRWQDIDGHDLLRRLVREHLVPALETAGHTLEVYDIETGHNPIRASRFDGVEITHDIEYGDADPPVAQVEYVEVPYDVVRRVAGLEIVAGEVLVGVSAIAQLGVGAVEAGRRLSEQLHDAGPTVPDFSPLLERADEARRAEIHAVDEQRAEFLRRCKEADVEMWRATHPTMPGVVPRLVHRGDRVVARFRD